MIIEKFRNNTDKMPVRALCSWYEFWESLTEIAPGAFYCLSKKEVGNLRIFLNTATLS